MTHQRHNVDSTRSNGNDSGIDIDRDDTSYSEQNSPTTTLNQSPVDTSVSFMSRSTSTDKTTERTSFVGFLVNDRLERIRPATMKNSENGEFILCQTARGNYIAYRTSIVPEWIKELVHNIELQQR
jgi:hypothetical protein